jgi:hypothetical protein
MKKYLTMSLLLLNTAIFSQTYFDVRSSVDWTTMEIKTQTAFSLASANIKLPGGRVQAEEIIAAEYPRIIRPLILNIPVDSSHTIGDLLDSGEITLRQIDALSRPVNTVLLSLSTDLAFLSAPYTISLTALKNGLIKHSKPAPIQGPLTPVQTGAYTGIIIVANDSLPIHGRNTASLVQPCIFPKIWDSDMNIVYERSISDPSLPNAGIVRYVPTEAIFRATPSGMDADLERFVGSNPLRIIAKGVFGIRPTDPVIDKADALLILSSEANIQLLREARVVMVLDAGVLKLPL